MFDIISWILGMKLSGGGGSTVVIDGDIVCTDDGEGNVTIELEGDDNGEQTDENNQVAGA